MLTLLFDGIAYGMLLFVLALGLAVTMGLMNFINLAHGAFAMAGGYILVLLMQRAGWPFLACLLLILIHAYFGIHILERGIIRFLYKRPLESLLATWGVSLVLQQLMRTIFGAANVQVSSPSWLTMDSSVSPAFMRFWNASMFFTVTGSANSVWLMAWSLASA